MFSLLGYNHNIRNVYRLAVPYSNGKPIFRSTCLRKHFLTFLQEHHCEFPIESADHPVVCDISRAKELQGAYSESNINDLQQEQMLGSIYSGRQHDERRLKIDKALDRMAQINPQLRDLFDLCIHSILLSEASRNAAGLGAHGGTSSKCIGLMWLTLHPSLSPQDLIEMLIHELTHTLVFIDELNHKHFYYRDIAKRETWAQSAILNRLRPMDKVVHSIVVATEILLARKSFLGEGGPLSVHPNSELIQSSTLMAIESVLHHPRLTSICKPRAIELTERAKKAILELQQCEGEVYDQPSL